MNTTALTHCVQFPHQHRPWRLIFPAGLWDMAVRRLIESPGVRAVGPLRWLNVSDARELLVEGMQFTAEPSVETSPITTSGRFTIAFVDGLSEATARSFLSSVSTVRRQIGLILLFDRQSPGRWLGMVTHQRQLELLSEIRVIGPRSVRIHQGLASPEHPDSISTPDPRWSRTVGALGERTWSLIRQATVTQIGAGRLGTSMAWQFAALGVKRLRLFDADQLATENLDAMPGIAAREVGQTKVQALARSLMKFRPDLELVIRSQPAEDPLSRRLLRERCDLLVTAVDDDMPRYLAACIARECLFPHLDVASDIQRDTNQRLHLMADARLLLPGTGCVRCVGGVDDLPNIIRRLSAPRDVRPLTPPPAWFEQRSGSLITLNQLVAGTAVQCWIDLLSGDLTTSYWHRLAWQPGRGLQSDSSAVGRGENCPVCLRTNG